MEQKLNINLITRMYCDHAYSVEDICLRLRYPQPAVHAVIEYHKLEHSKPQRNQSSY
jgi:hypothetical protein